MIISKYMKNGKTEEYRNILIIGAGIGGKLLKKDIEKNHPKCKVIGFVDDKESRRREGNVLGDLDALSKINKIYRVDEMVIAIPSADGKLIRRILMNNMKNRVSIRIVPRNQRIISKDDVRYSEVTELELEDFLGRPFLKKNVKKLVNFYKNKTVLITGGAGSIGSEIVRQLLDLEIKKVIIYDNSEYLTFTLHQNLREKNIDSKKYRFIIGSILNKNKLDKVIKTEKPDFIFHAAAYKHVYLMEENLDEAVSNNIIGTKNIVDVAVENGVKNFIFIATDKVVNPSSIMGATKKIAEYYIKCLHNNKKTKFNIVRFGNVINSNGSVLPLFERQIKEYKYVTVTHKDVRRFFMSIREASQLVINSATRNKQGEIFILDMGELINIYETAICLIRSKNLLPGKDIEVKFIGLKPGEKIIEELFTDSETKNLVKTNIDNVFRLKNFDECPIDIDEVINNFKEMVAENVSDVKLREYFVKIFPSLKK